jgi:hypothetical protein
MKTLNIFAFILFLAVTAGCSTRTDNSNGAGIENSADSITRVAPTSDGMPATGAPRDEGSPPDSAAQSFGSDTIQ